MEHTLQQARHTLGYYRSQKYWQDDLRDYREPRYHAVRAFSFEDLDGTVSFSKTEGTYPYPYEERQKEWIRFWPDCFEDSKTPSYAEAGTYKYSYPNLESGETETVQVKFENELCAASSIDHSGKGLQSTDYYLVGRTSKCRKRNGRNLSR